MIIADHMKDHTTTRWISRRDLIKAGGAAVVAAVSLPAQWTAGHGLPALGATLRIAFPARHLVVLDAGAA